MRDLKLIIMALALGAAGCQISPVITDPTGPGHAGSRYSDCRRAARDVCKIRESGEAARKQCVAEATFDCLKGGAE